MGCDANEAEDWAQTTLVTCYVSWSKVSKTDDQDAYVYRILANTLRSARQRRSSIGCQLIALGCELAYTSRSLSIVTRV